MGLFIGIYRFLFIQHLVYLNIFTCLIKAVFKLGKEIRNVIIYSWAVLVALTFAEYIEKTTYYFIKMSSKIRIILL